MENDQIATELRELIDRLDRLEVRTDQNIAELHIVTERLIPASVADIGHTLMGVNELLAGVAGTTAKLASQFASLTDRVTLIEKGWE